MVDEEDLFSFDLNMNQVTHGMIITNATNAKDGGADRTY